jgi:hypothetical protein
MYRVKTVVPSPEYTLKVEFEDGLKGTVLLKDRLFGPMFEPLRDKRFFAQVSVDPYGTICWPNGADLAPDAMYRRTKEANGQPNLVSARSDLACCDLPDRRPAIQPLRQPPDEIDVPIQEVILRQSRPRQRFLRAFVRLHLAKRFNAERGREVKLPK